MVHNVEGFIRERQVLLQVPFLNGWARGMKIEIHPIGVKSLTAAEVEAFDHVKSNANVTGVDGLAPKSLLHPRHLDNAPYPGTHSWRSRDPQTTFSKQSRVRLNVSLKMIVGQRLVNDAGNLKRKPLLQASQGFVRPARHMVWGQIEKVE